MSLVTPVLVEKLLAGVTLAPGAHEAIEVRAPFTGGLLARIPAGGEADIEAAVNLARAAQPAWAARSLDHRARILLRFHDLLLDRREEGLDLVQLETGKARLHAFEEAADCAMVAAYYARNAARLLAPRRRRGAIPLLTRTLELRSPVGVVGFVVPWNYPLNLAVTDALAALMAGNTAVLKPDHQTSLTALWAVALLREAGLPPEVMPVVTGEGPVAGPPLIERADFVMFTGSTATGRRVAGQTAARLIGCSLELGGKNPLLVLADAPLEAAVEGALRGCFVGAGQVCISFERIYVHQSLFQAFLARFAERARSLRLGAALDYTADMGSLTSPRQMNTVEEHVADALSQGATLVAGGKRRPDLGPLFYEPTILTGVRPGMRLFAEETFGPVVAVYPFETEDQAIELANATRYGLNASLWTRNTPRGLALATRIRAGSVNLNEAYAAAWGSVDAPIGGMKESGLGRRHGEEGLLKFTESQTIAIQRLLPLAPPRGITTETYTRWLTRVLKLKRHLGI